MISDPIFKILVLVFLVSILGLDFINWRHDSQHSELFDILIAQHEDIDIDVHEIAEALNIEHHEEGEEEEGNRY